MQDAQKRNVNSHKNSVNHSPFLIKRSLTYTDKPNSLSSLTVNKLRNNPKNDKNQYVKLTYSSIENNFPVSKLRPFGSFNSIESIQNDMKHKNKFASAVFERSKKISLNDNNSFMYDEMSNLSSTIFTKQKHISTAKHDSIYRRKQKSSNKKHRKTTSSKFITQCTDKQLQDDDQCLMVNDYMREQTQIVHNRQATFENFNEKIKEQYPNYFQPIAQHQESKCKSRSCSQGFFKRKKFSVGQQYNFQQSILETKNFQKKRNKIRFKEQKVKMIDDNKNFCLFSRSKNRILDMDKDLSFIEAVKVIRKQPKQQFNIATRLMFEEQSRIFYKKYMRSSSANKQKTVQNEMKIKIK